MKYLLDTNVLIAMFRGQYKIREAIAFFGFEQCCISEITLAEIKVGAYKSSYEKHAHEINFLYDNFRILPITPVLDTYAKLRAGLEANGTPVDNFDLLIAASALNNKMTIITHNLKHFSKIDNLTIQDWEQ